MQLCLPLDRSTLSQLNFFSPLFQQGRCSIYRLVIMYRPMMQNDSYKVHQMQRLRAFCLMTYQLHNLSKYTCIERKATYFKGKVQEGKQRQLIIYLSLSQSPYIYYCKVSSFYPFSTRIQMSCAYSRNFFKRFCIEDFHMNTATQSGFFSSDLIPSLGARINRATKLRKNIVSPFNPRYRLVHQLLPLFLPEIVLWYYTDY